MRRMYGFGLLVGLLLAAGAAGAWWLESRPRIPSNLKGIANAEPVIGWALTEGLIGEPIGTAQSGSIQVNVLSVLADSLRTVLLIQVDGVQPGAYWVEDLEQGKDWHWWYRSHSVKQPYPTGVFFVYESGGPPPSRREPLRLTMVVHDQPLVVEIPADRVLYLPEEHWAPARQVTVDGVTVELVRVIQTPAELKVQFRSVLDPAHGTASPRPELIRLADGTVMEGNWMMTHNAVSSVRFRRPRGNRLPALTIGAFRWDTNETFFPLEAGTTQMVGPETVTLTQAALSNRMYEVLFAWPDSSPLRTLSVRVVDPTTRKTLDAIEAYGYNRPGLAGHYFVPSSIDPAQAQIGVVGWITGQGRWELPLHR